MPNAARSRHLPDGMTVATPAVDAQPSGATISFFTHALTNSKRDEPITN
jgi:hypothetical protein